MLFEDFNESMNFVGAVCIDGCSDGASFGRLYHCYSREPEPFRDDLTMLKKLGEVMDRTGFPQSATELATFGKKNRNNAEGAKRLMSTKQVVSQSGDKGTFVVHVQYRENSTWQGQVVWVEKNIKKNFRSALEMLKLIDSALAMDDEKE